MARQQLVPSDFVHLHNHTQYSLLDGLTKVPALIERVKSLGMGAVAITDHGTLSGLIEFYKEARQADIKPILGMEAYVAARTLRDKDPSKDKNYYHLILLAMNHQGLLNLMRLSTIANLDGFYYKPRIDHELLKKHNEGLIVLSGCIGGEIGDFLRQGQYQKAKEIAIWYKEVLGDRYYLEIQDHGHPKHPSKWDEQVRLTEETLRLSKEIDIPVVLTCDAHYLLANDQAAHEILLCVQTGAFLSDPGRMSLKNFELHVTDPNEIIKRWGKDHPEVITNTRQIAERCSVKLDLGKILIPKFSVPNKETEESYLQKQVYRGLVWRYGAVSESEASKMAIAVAQKSLPKHVLERAKFELGIINKMNFNSYFLIIADVINWAKNQGIVFGPGRGSAAGSIIAYALKITELDPIKYDLLFERFLNPDRVSMPDIDIDIQDSRRDEVIQYCIDKYGKDRVANIVTFGRMAARNAVRDVARVLQVPYAEADRLAKMIPPPVQGRHIPLSSSLQQNSELKREYETSEQARQVFDLAIQLEGTIRSHGVHAAGVVIAPDDIVKYAPLEMAQKGVIATQYSMGPIMDDLGLLKIDFLGLSNLTIIKNALRIVKRVYGKEIDIEKLSLTDDETFGLLQRGDTTGVFQLESAGMKRYLKELQPTVFEDIIAMVALYRPGPMQWIEDFVARKHGRKTIEYLHPAMEAALKTTYGVIVYQEQVMQISKEMCGFTGGQADTLRKAIGKKDPAVLAKLKSDFIEGAVKKVGADRNMMEAFWENLEDFAAYCFNKSHAACYGMIAYQTAYLKAHYPSAFMAALMTSDFDNTDRLAIEINECKHMGLEVLPPDVNESFVEFAVVPNTKQIRFGMSAIKNVGTAAVEEILRARAVDGSFSNLEDFLSKVSIRVVNKKTLESLIKAGALDGFGDRSVLLHNLDVLLAYAGRLQKQAASGQTDLFGISEEEVQTPPLLRLTTTAAPHEQRERLQWERELLGLYLSEHPLESFRVILEENTVPLAELRPEHDGKSIVIGGIIEDIREITTKNGQKMAFVKLTDFSGEVEVILFPGVFGQFEGSWQRDTIVKVKGKVTAQDKGGRLLSDVKVLANEAQEITTNDLDNYTSTGRKKKPPLPKRAPLPAELMERTPRVYIRLPSTEDHAVLSSLKTVIDNNLGETEVVLVLGKGEKKQIIKLPMRLKSDNDTLEILKNMVGNENVKLH